MSDSNMRYNVTISDGQLCEIHRDVSAYERNRLVDFAFRHSLRLVVTVAHRRVRGEGTYR